MYGIANLLNVGAVRALDTLPPTNTAIPSFSGSAIGRAGHTENQLPQYIHFSSLIVTDFAFGFGLIAAFGQEAMMFGISQLCATSASFTLGIFLWIPTQAMSEQCTAPHMFRQQAMETFSLAGRSSFLKYSNRSSITALTVPEASVAALWQ